MTARAMSEVLAHGLVGQPALRATAPVDANARSPRSIRPRTHPRGSDILFILLARPNQVHCPVNGHAQLASKASRERLSPSIRSVVDRELDWVCSDGTQAVPCIGTTPASWRLHLVDLHAGPGSWLGLATAILPTRYDGIGCARFVPRQILVTREISDYRRFCECGKRRR